jgi:hypothetical protein
MTTRNLEIPRPLLPHSSFETHCAKHGLKPEIIDRVASACITRAPPVSNRPPSVSADARRLAGGAALHRPTPSPWRLAGPTSLLSDTTVTCRSCTGQTTNIDSPRAPRVRPVGATRKFSKANIYKYDFSKDRLFNEFFN